MTTSLEEDLADEMAKVPMAVVMEMTNMAGDPDVMVRAEVPTSKVMIMMMSLAKAHTADEEMAQTSTERDAKDLALEGQAMMVPAVTMITTEVTMAPETRSHLIQEGEVMATAQTAPTTDDQACQEAHPLTAETRVVDARVPDSEVMMEAAVMMTTMVPDVRVTSMVTTGRALPMVAAVTMRKIAAVVSTTTATRRATHSRGETARPCSDPETSMRARRRSTDVPRTARETDAGRSSDAATVVPSMATTTTLTAHHMVGKIIPTAETDLFPEEKYPSTADPEMKTVDPVERDLLSTVMMLPEGGVLHREVVVAAAAMMAHSSRSN